MNADHNNWEKKSEAVDIWWGWYSGVTMAHYITYITLLFSHLADAFIQSDLQIRKSNYNYKLKLYYIQYIHTFEKI